MRRIIATLSFFTRIPFWRLTDVPVEYYKRVVPLWPLAGYLTGGFMLVVFLLALQVLPFNVSIVLALVSRILLTGALHEDGFADFCDGFGGGTSRERTLEIMKDSHIGTYGVLALVIYFLLMYNVWSALFSTATPLFFVIIICADTFSKFCSSHIIDFLPYAREEKDSKSKLIYLPMCFRDMFANVILGLTPCIVLCTLLPALISAIVLACIGAVFACTFMICLMRRTLKGYTGDCCGATFIVTEIVFYFFLLISNS